MCARKQSMKFDIVWEDCIQEDARVANREDLLREDDKSLATHTKRIKQSNFKKDIHKEHKLPNKFHKKRNYSKQQCYNCHKIGHIFRECPSKNNNNKRHHAHLAEYEDEEEIHRKILTK